MSRILSPTPIVITISYNELNGNIDCSMTKELPFPTVVAVLCEVLKSLGGRVMQQIAGIRDGGTDGGTRGGNGPVVPFDGPKGAA